MRPSAFLLLVAALSACSESASDPPSPIAATGLAIAVESLPAPSAMVKPAPPLPADCTASASVSIFVSPATPKPGKSIRFVVTNDAALEGTLIVRDASGAEVGRSETREGGPPYFWRLTLDAPAQGTYRAYFATDQEAMRTCKEVVVDDVAETPRVPQGMWTTTRVWNRETENLYSAWIQALFDAPVGEPLSFAALHDALHDPRRNFLHDHLTPEEDAAGPKAPVIDPDCADLPFALRAYFSFKLELPFAYSSCTRGGGGRAPECKMPRSNLEWPLHRNPDRMAEFAEFVRTTLADTVHSGTPRTAGDDDATNFYPVRLNEQSLRPGTIFADPYGHVLVVVRRLPQTADHAGMLLAVDGQPDGTVGRKRYWRGNFLFALDPSFGSPGFKRFRPVVVEKGVLRSMTNQEITTHLDYGDWGLEQYEHGVEGFYDRVDDVLSPEPLDPKRALLEMIDALEEQVKVRVGSVDNGRKYRQGGGKLVEMPEGSSIFETVGPWEDFSTPSRDLRLLVAIDMVTGAPARIARRLTRYAVERGQTADDVRTQLETTLGEELSQRKFEYVRSDASTFALTLTDVVKRAEFFEAAYNPNDCPEQRWGAPEGSDEAATCKMHAPWKQSARMRKMRKWFKERKRPPRGS
ncbi:MAG TPA: hypothetical protein PK156_41290 [Polyangium sp.]|nr:hypothetical protein [Polyangium sp.]